MVKYSKYPEAIDTSTELPLATDNVTEVKAEVVNRQRDALINIESELGTNPSGTYSTVKDRFDAIEQGVAGSGSDLTIAQEDTNVVAQTTKMNFTGAVTVTKNGSHNADIVIGDAGTVQRQETFATADSQTAFTLNFTPIQSNSVMMFVNGVKQDYGVDYSVVGKAVTYSGVTLIASDKIEFWYLQSLGAVPSAEILNVPTKMLVYGISGLQQTVETTAEQKGCIVFNPTEFFGGNGSSIRLVSVLQVATIGQTCSLELFNLTDGITVTTITSTSTVPEIQMSSVLTTPSDLPNTQTLYGLRMFRTGGTTTDFVGCYVAYLEVNYTGAA